LTVLPFQGNSSNVIGSFKCAETQRIFEGEQVKGFPVEIQGTARRKLLYMRAAGRLGDLASPPGNHLEKLGGDRQGQWSIRINKQFRICFTWRDNQAHDVEITDYH
jgi:proteic killer suppression protein